MFRNFIKFVSIIAGIFLVTFGAHGIYFHFYRIEYLMGNGSKLFGYIEVPLNKIPIYLDWMAVKGFYSWFVPAIFIGFGVALWWWQSRWVWRR